MGKPRSQGFAMSPRYDYKCPNCGIKIEQKRHYDDDAPEPMCGDCLVSMEKVYYAPATHFKGSGWGSSK